MTGRVYALASGKGGVGKTTTTLNLGVTLRSAGHSVALVDADLGMANLATVLDIEHETTLHDVLAGDATIREALSEEVTGFAVLPGTRELSGFAAAEPEKLGSVLEALAKSYEYVLVDTGGTLSYEDVLPLGMVDEILLVTTSDAAAVGDTGKTMELADLVGGDVRGVVVNQSVEAVEPETVADELETTLLATVPQDQNVAESTIAGRPIKAHAPDSPASKAFDQLAASISDEVSVDAAADDATMPADHSESGLTAAQNQVPEQHESDPSGEKKSVQSATTAPPGASIMGEAELGVEETGDNASAEDQSSGISANHETGGSGRPATNSNAEGERSQTLIDEEEMTRSSGIIGWLSRIFG